MTTNQALELLVSHKVAADMHTLYIYRLTHTSLKLSVKMRLCLEHQFSATKPQKDLKVVFGTVDASITYSINISSLTISNKLN